MPFRFRSSGVWSSVLLLGVALSAQQAAPAPGTTDAHAEQVLAQARAAAGSAAGLKDLKSLEVDFSQRRLVALPTPGAKGQSGPPREIASDVKMQFLLPGDFRQDENIDLPMGMVSGGMTITFGLQGDRGWMKRVGGPSFGPRPGGPGAGEAGAGEFGASSNPQAAARRQQMMAHRLQADEIRNLLLLTLWPPVADSLQWKYVGVAHAPDGSADVLDAFGPNHFTVRLFLDQKTHRLLMMSYRDVIPFSGGAGGRRGRFGRPGGPQQPGPPPQRPQLFNRARQMPPLQDIELHFSDFRSEHGLMMPHRVVATTHGKPFEQWTIHKVKWNPGTIRPTDFEQPAK